MSPIGFRICVIIYLTTKETCHVPLTRKVQILEINENVILLATHQKMFSKKKYLSDMKCDLKTSELCQGSVCLNDFIFIFIFLNIFSYLLDQ